MVESSGLLSRTRELSLAEVQILHSPFREENTLIKRVFVIIMISNLKF